ncbi:hypothetical protein GCM10011611_43460 [Aliidongia dinghuensis]|uniref:Uncharacterized protein n=1 Tax=Aliidongia dinghuensis TaxID=1867774 RepID=A0A8J3E545_9PROT|nr:hypothetical protein GCM10011611_43460 [Aliidongia dinghuensis]
MNRAKGQDRPAGMQPDTLDNFGKETPETRLLCLFRRGARSSQMRCGDLCLFAGHAAGQKGFTTTRITIPIMRTVGTSFTTR